MPEDTEDFTTFASGRAMHYAADTDTDIPLEANEVWKATKQAQMELYSTGSKVAADIEAVVNDDSLPTETRRARAAELADKATSGHKDALAKSQGALVVLEKHLVGLATPKAPSRAADLANARDEIRTRLDGLSDGEMLAEVNQIAEGPDRDLVGTLISAWGAALLRKHDVDVAAVRAAAIKGTEAHGDQTGKRAAKALGQALINAKKAHGAAAVACLAGIENARGHINSAANQTAQAREQDIVQEANRRLRLRGQR